MKDFKDSTKTQSGHHFPGSMKHHMATGGIVAPFRTPGRSAPAAMRPSMPRPHVMPNMQKVSMPRTKLARGGSYNGSPEGNSLEMANRPYSQIEVEHPRNNARPGYAKGGKSGIHIKPSHEGLFTKKMTGSKSGKLTGGDVQKGLNSSSGSTRKQANFARMARRGFKPLCAGGKVGYADGGSVAKIDKEISKHVAAPHPSGHGVKSGNLAFMSKPMFGKG